MGLFSVLGVGTRGLIAAQLGMEVSGQNIANANVTGYSRKRINAASAYRKDDQFGQMGFGVDVINIERMRDRFIDEQIRGQNQESGYFEQVNNSLKTIENVLTEPGDTGLQHFMDEFFNSWQNLANNPADEAARTVVRTDAESLTDVFHNLSGQLRDLQASQNNVIESDVKRVNEIADQIYNLNKEIAAVEIDKQHANDSRDQRDQLLAELSKLVDINVVESDTGAITVTTMGNILVSPVGTQKLELTSTTSRRPDGTTQGNVGIDFANSKTPYYPLSGAIKGLIDTRDTVIPYYEQQLDSLAIALVQRVNEKHETGFNLMGYSGLDFFDPGITGASDISVAPEILSNVRNIAAAKGGQVLGFTENITHIFGTPAINLTHRSVQANSITVTNSVTGVVLQQGVDYVVDLARGTFQLLNATHSGANLVINYQYNTGGFAGDGDNANALDIAGLQHDFTMVPDALGNYTSTFEQFYGATVAKLGLDSNDTQSTLDTRNALIKQYQDQQDSIAGVSLDEEMADLIKFQHTYQASARVITTASAMLDALLNIT